MIIKKVYQGLITAVHQLHVVTVNGKPLDPRLDIADHSPSGFSWGYVGSGPAQLAIALMADAFDVESARRYARSALKTWIKGLPQEEGWVITEHDLAMVLRNYMLENVKKIDARREIGDMLKKFNL